MYTYTFITITLVCIMLQPLVSTLESKYRRRADVHKAHRNHFSRSSVNSWTDPSKDPLVSNLDKEVNKAYFKAGLLQLLRVVLLIVAFGALMIHLMQFQGALT